MDSGDYFDVKNMLSADMNLDELNHNAEFMTLNKDDSLTCLKKKKQPIVFDWDGCSTLRFTLMNAKLDQDLVIKEERHNPFIEVHYLGKNYLTAPIK